MKNPVCISPADNCPEQDTDVANLMTYFEKRRHFDNQHESESYERFHESAPLSWTLYMTRARELNRTPTQLRRNRHRLTCRSIYFWGCSRKISLRELHQRVIDLLIWKGCFNRNDPTATSEPISLRPVTRECTQNAHTYEAQDEEIPMHWLEHSTNKIHMQPYGRRSTSTMHRLTDHWMRDLARLRGLTGRLGPESLELHYPT